MAAITSPAASFAKRRGFDLVSMMQVMATSSDERGVHGRAPRSSTLTSGSPEHVVGDLLLGIRHRSVKLFEGHNQILQPVDMCLGEFLIHFQILHCGHVLWGRCPSLRDYLVHGGGIFAHRLRYGVP